MESTTSTTQTSRPGLGHTVAKHPGRCKQCKTAWTVGATIYRANSHHWCTSADCALTAMPAPMPTPATAPTPEPAAKPESLHLPSPWVFDCTVCHTAVAMSDMIHRYGTHWCSEDSCARGIPAAPAAPSKTPKVNEAVDRLAEFTQIHTRVWRESDRLAKEAVPLEPRRDQLTQARCTYIQAMAYIMG